MSTLTLDDILQPISADAPCGTDLQFSAEFDAIDDMRRADDPTLDQGEWVRDLKVADFAGVRQLCTELLQQRTKDLRLCGWLTDAWARTDGFGGLAQGLAWTTALCERYWPQIHPLPDGDDQDERVGNLSWLLKQIEELAATYPLLKTETGSYGRRVIEAARATRADDDNDERRALAEQVHSALNKAPEAQLIGLLDDLEAAQGQLQALQRQIDERLGADGPNFASARQSLEDTRHMAQRLARERGITNSDPTTDTAVAQADTAASEATPSGAPGALTHRAQALAQLRAVADFFRRTEPHSPVAYLADKAARWGEVPLHQWLRTVVKDQQVLGNLEELLGVEPPAHDH